MAEKRRRKKQKKAEKKQGGVQSKTNQPNKDDDDDDDDDEGHGGASERKGKAAKQVDGLLTAAPVAIKSDGSFLEMMKSLTGQAGGTKEKR